MVLPARQYNNGRSVLLLKRMLKVLNTQHRYSYFVVPRTLCVALYTTYLEWSLDPVKDVVHDARSQFHRQRFPGPQYWVSYCHSSWESQHTRVKGKLGPKYIHLGNSATLSQLVHIHTSFVSDKNCFMSCFEKGPLKLSKS